MRIAERTVSRQDLLLVKLNEFEDTDGRGASGPQNSGLGRKRVIRVRPTNPWFDSEKP